MSDAKEHPGLWVMTFDRYKGKTLDWLDENDPIWLGRMFLTMRTRPAAHQAVRRFFEAKVNEAVKAKKAYALKYNGYAYNSDSNETPKTRVCARTRESGPMEEGAAWSTTDGRT